MPKFSHHVLVVDDEPINRQVLKAQLSSAGFNVTEAADGLEALQLLETSQQSFDLMLLDVMMPRLSGFDTCRQLRDKLPALQLPVIFLTAKAQTSDVLAGFNAGGNDYLIKPFSRDELLARIRIHLELKTAFKIISEYSKNLEAKVMDRTKDLMDAQQQLVLKQKMAALGVLTAGVAHEINNPNNFVQGALQNVHAWRDGFKNFLNELLSDEADPELVEAFGQRFAKLDDQLSLIDTGSKRIDKIVKGLRSVTHLDEAEQLEVDVADGLEHTLMLLKPTIPEHIRTDMDIQVRPRILCWAAELNQVFMNILINAVHAVEYRIKQNPAMSAQIVITSSIEHDALCIVFKDNGCGMAPEVLARACDPFFTTKEVGSGAGLGLSISRDIVEKHQGRLILESTVGEGTQVRVLLPLNVH